jgi:rare lipoprotein A
MLKFKKPALGNVTQSRTAITMFAATLLVGGSITEASAKSRHHHHRHHHHSHHAGKSPAGSWRDAKAAITPSS